MAEGIELTSVFSSSRSSHSSRDSFEDDTHAPLLRLEPNSDMKAGEADDSASEISHGTTELIHENPPWWSYFWDFDPSRTVRERKFVRKLDCFLLTILSLGYFIKNLDQTNISNAYVSGMKEALNMNANQLNLIDVAWTTGYVLGQLPSQIILTKVRPSIWIPSCELLWTFLTLSLAMATTSNQVIGIRFFVGLLESIFYPAAHFLLGAWYKPSELGKRAGIFHASSAAGGILSGYLQAAVYKDLNGTLGKAGWQWLFVMDGLISLPICIAGFYLIPDLPENTRAFYLNKDDAELSRKRMDDVDRAPREPLTWSTLTRIFTRWHVYALTVLYVVFINTGPSSSVQPFALWLKDTGWSVSLVNILPTIGGCIQLLTTVTFSMLSDFLRNRPAVMSISTFIGFFSAFCLALWKIPLGLKWFAFFVSRSAVPYGPLSMSWANEICGGDAEERALVLGVMNASGYAFGIWVPYLTYPVRDAPEFRKGFRFSVLAFLVQFGMTGLVAWLWRREKRGKDRMKRRRRDSVSG